MNTPALAKLQTLCELLPEVLDISPVTQGTLDWTCSMRTTHGEYQLVGMSGYPPEVWFADEAGEPDPQPFYLRTAFMLKVEAILNNKVLDLSDAAQAPSFRAGSAVRGLSSKAV